MSLLSRLKRDRRGATMVELALALPIFLILIIACADMVRLIVLHQKLDRLSRAMADLSSQSRGLTSADLAQIYEVTDSIMWPFDFASSGRVFISGLGANGAAVKVNWQAQGAGALSASSRIGSQGGAATVPSGFTLQGSETSVAAEAFFDYQPIFTSVPFFGSIVEAGILYHSSFFPPRLIP